MQAITIAEDLFESLLRRTDFISKHIFPGGALPAVSKLRNLAADNRLQVTNVDAFGDSYARTLRRWRERFEAACLAPTSMSDSGGRGATTWRTARPDSA